MDKKNNKIGSCNSALALMCKLFVFFPLVNVCNLQAQDLLSGEDLIDSPLSQSLSASMAVNFNGSDHLIVINQHGISNQAIVSQMGAGLNSVQLSQTGANNQANLIQDGFGNQINLQQSGQNNLAEVIQEGDANIANIWQVGEQSFTVHQIGSGLVVNITQY
jgi:minor curlin subunit